MTPIEFTKYMNDKSDDDYGICPPPISAADGLQILIKHFLGPEWFTSMPLSQEQVNTEAIFEILWLNPNKRRIK